MHLHRLTGLSGIVLGLLTTLTVPLYFVHEGAPPAWNVLTRNLISLVMCALLIVFLSGLRQVISRPDAPYDWLAGVAHSAGLVYIAVTLVATALEVGGVLSAAGGAVDPTVEGPLAAGNVLLHGSVARLITAVLLFAAGYVILRSRALPAWTGRSAYLIAAVNLAFVPSLYFGTDPARFYSALGWGNTALAASLISYWVVAVGVVLVRRGQKSDFSALSSRRATTS
ncbi:hypothetical protein WEH80_05635 [Actinomycetes bacterium KLBMP 9759]